MNLQKNRPLIFLAGFFGILLLTEIIFLSLANIELSKHRQDLKSSLKRLEQMHRRKLFPSIENVNALKKNLDELQYYSRQLVSIVMGDPFPRDAVEATEFSARAQDVIERFQKSAEQSGIALPEFLEVGFSDYASGGLVPDNGNVPRLSRQLYSVERVASVLMRSGVDSIDILTRDIFELNADDDLPFTRRRGVRNGPSKSNRQPLARLIATNVHPKNLYLIERVYVSFSAKENVVWHVLNLFASAPHFMVVSEVSHSTKTSILNYNPEAVKHSKEGSDAELRYLANGILTGDKALSRSERIIAGNEVIQAHLVVDVYNFEPQVETK